MDQIQKKHNDMPILRENYRWSKALRSTQGINTSEASGGFSFLGPNSKSRKNRPRTSEASGGSSAHQ